MYPQIAKFNILPGKEKEAIAALKKLALAVKKSEPGTLLYMVHTPNLKEQSLPTPAAGEVIFFEIYKDKAAYVKHVTGSNFTNFMRDHGSLFLNASAAVPGVYIRVEVLTQLAGFARAGI